MAFEYFACTIPRAGVDASKMSFVPYGFLCRKGKPYGRVIKKNKTHFTVITALSTPCYGGFARLATPFREQ